MNEKMNWTLPDGGRPIRVGDPSFIYENVYHPIIWLGEVPYRPRVELLLIKDRRMVFMQVFDKNNDSGENAGYPYRIPGGSIDPDADKMQQAINETNEEGLKSCKNTVNPGVQYYEKYEPGVLDTHKFPIEYVGTINDVFVAEYAGEYPKEKVEEKDLDNDMAEKGKFHYITSVAKFLRKEHIDALLKCNMLDKDIMTLLKIQRSKLKGEEGVTTNTSLRFSVPSARGSMITVPGTFTTKLPILESGGQITVPGNRLYHGTDAQIDVFHPYSLDLGNIYQPPGWSTFCFAERTLALRFGLMRVLQRVTDSLDENNAGKYKDLVAKWSLVNQKPFVNIQKFQPSFFIGEKFYIYTFDSTKLKELGIGNDTKLQEFTFRDDNVVPMDVETVIVDKNMLLEHVIFCQNEKDFQTLLKNDMKDVDEYSRGAYACMLSRDYNKNSCVGKLKWDIHEGKLKPGDDILDYAEANGYDIFEIGFITGFNWEKNTKRLPAMEGGSGTSFKPLTPDLMNQLKGKYQLPMLKHLRTPDNTNKGWAMFSGEDLAGVVMYDRSTKYITALEVRPEYQKNGYGQMLLDRAKRDGASKLTVNKSNEKAIRLYKKNGFKETSTSNSSSFNITMEASLTAKQRANIDPKDYGLPKKRKYPMPDKKHVRAAIRFFNYVSPADEKELTKNIKRKIKQYDMEDEIKVGEDNRFSKYMDKAVAEGIVIPIDAAESMVDYLQGSNPHLSDFLLNHMDDVIYYDTEDIIPGSISAASMIVQTEPGKGHLIIMTPDEDDGFNTATRLLERTLHQFDFLGLDIIQWDIADDDQDMIAIATRFQFKEIDFVDGCRSFVFNKNYRSSMEGFDENIPNVLTDEETSQVYWCHRDTMFSSYAITPFYIEPSFDVTFYETFQQAIREYPYKKAGLFFVWTKLPSGKSIVVGSFLASERNWGFSEWYQVNPFSKKDASELIQVMDIPECVSKNEATYAIETVLTQPIVSGMVTENKNGDIFLTTPDPKPVMEYSGQPKLIYVITEEDDWDGKNKGPIKTKDSYRAMNCYRSIDLGLMDMDGDITGKTYYVYSPDPSSKVDLYRPTVQQVPAVIVTGEMWIENKPKMRLVGAIRVKGKRSTPPRSYILNGQVATLNEWEWDWIQKTSRNAVYEFYKPEVMDYDIIAAEQRIIELVEKASRFKYGYVYNGKPVTNIVDENKFVNQYRTLTTKDVEKYKTGTCFDMTKYVYETLMSDPDVKNGNIILHAYYVEGKDRDGDSPCHTFPVVEFTKNGANRLWVLETAWKPKCGIYKYSFFKEMLLKYVYIKWKPYDVMSVKHVEYDPLKYPSGLTCFEFMKRVGNCQSGIASGKVKGLQLLEAFIGGTPVLEADDPEPTDYSSVGGGDAPDNNNAADTENAGNEDTGQQEADNPLAGDNENAEETPEGDDEGANDPEPTDYGDTGDDMGMDDGGDSDTNSTDSGGDTSSASADSSSIDTNILVKNYSLIGDYEKMYSLIDDINRTIDSTLKATPEENRVLAQVSKNLTDAKNFITHFLQFHFKNNDHTYNLYYYMLIVQILKLNLKMVEKTHALKEK